MKIVASILALAAGITMANACSRGGTLPHSGPATEASTPKKSAAELSKLHHATFAMGCFWCEEAVFESIKGVEEVVSGYAGGPSQNPTYEEVGGGRTGHAEAIEVYYDSSKIDYPTLLRVYFASGDPTQVNGQGPDRGSQYRSVIFYRNPMEKAMAEKEIAARNASGKYHQDYVPQHPENPYVQGESIPRLKRAQSEVRDLVKADRLRI
jgi:peptide-methionine (S)-S-oxide reductase